MRKFMFVVASAVMCGVFATASLVAQEKTAPAKGQAGQVNAATPDPARLMPKAITGNWATGWHCMNVTPDVHDLGWVPGGRRVVIQFERQDGSDPIAVLTTVRVEGIAAPNVDSVYSDDTGGNLNPEFDVTRAYNANYILTVGAAVGSGACYAYKMWLF